MNDVIDKIVLISGASSGIGEATVREFAGKGARLFICARRTDHLQLWRQNSVPMWRGMRST